jgi:hypothetical protein
MGNKSTGQVQILFPRFLQVMAGVAGKTGGRFGSNISAFPKPVPATGSICNLTGKMLIPENKTVPLKIIQHRENSQLFTNPSNG